VVDTEIVRFKEKNKTIFNYYALHIHCLPPPGPHKVNPCKVKTEESVGKLSL
jgi:hypothetical protein